MRIGYIIKCYQRKKIENDKVLERMKNIFLNYKVEENCYIKF